MMWHCLRLHAELSWVSYSKTASVQGSEVMHNPGAHAAVLYVSMHVCSVIYNSYRDIACMGQTGSLEGIIRQ